VLRLYGSAFDASVQDSYSLADWNLVGKLKSSGSSYAMALCAAALLAQVIPVPLQKGLKAFPLARCPRVVDEAKDEDAYEASDDQQSIYSMASSIYKNLELQASNVKNRILAFKLPS